MPIDTWLLRLRRNGLGTWTLTSLIIAVAVALRFALPLSGAFITFYPAVLFCALTGGRRPGMAALLVTSILSIYFVEPLGLWSMTLWGTVSWLTFVVFGGAVIAAVDVQQQAMARSRELSEALKRQQVFSDTLISAAPSLTYIFDIPESRIVFISEQSRDLLGHAPQEMMAMGGEILNRMVHPDDVQKVQERFARMVASSDGHLFDLEYRILHKNGSWVWLYSRDRVFKRQPDGTPIQVLGVATDLTARREAEEKLRASEERFRGIFENAPVGISITDMDGNFVQCNPAYERMFGYSQSELRHIPFSTIVHPDDRAANLAEMNRLVSRDVPYFEIVNRSVHKDGRVVWVQKFVLVLEDRFGEPANMVALVSDMTDRKRAEEQIRLLMREVNHRSKNLLAVVQSVARQTASYGDPETYAQRFSERLQGLAASHDLLVNNGWQGVDLSQLVTSQLSHFEDLVGGRITLSGPPIRVNASAAQSLGMSLHELATNAGKYGALSGKAGKVAVAWSVAWGEEGPVFTISWTESGGPEVTVPERRGLGSLILTRLAEQSLSASVNADFRPSGLVWTLSGPADRIVEKSVH